MSKHLYLKENKAEICKIVTYKIHPVNIKIFVQSFYKRLFSYENIAQIIIYFLVKCYF